MAKPKTKKVSNRELAGRITRLGKLRQEKASVAAAERQLTDSVREAMEAKRLDEAKGNGFIATLATVSSLTVNVAKFRAKAGPTKFLQCVRVDVKAARGFFDDKTLAKLGTVAKSKQVRISPVPARGGK